MRRSSIFKGVMVNAFLVPLILIGGNVKALDLKSADFKDGVFKLDKDYTENITITGDSKEKLTLDLNGHSITSADDSLIVKGTNLTIKGNGKIISSGDTGIDSIQGANVTMTSGEVEAKEFGAFVGGKSTFTLSGGTITTIDNCGIGGNGSNTDDYKDYTINVTGGTINANIQTAGYVSCGIYHPNRGTVNVSGGTINSSNGAGIVQRAGVLNVTGGTINVQGTTTGKVGDSRVVVSAKPIVVDKEANYPEVATLKTNVTGGTYEKKPEQVADGYKAYRIIDSATKKERFVVANPDKLEERVTVGPNTAVTAEDSKIIDTKKGNKTIAGYYDVDVYLILDGYGEVDSRAETKDLKTVSLPIPAGLPKVKDGYVRKYTVIRVHNGEAEELPATVDGNNLVVKSNKFSVYAVAYEDVKASNNSSSKENADAKDSSDKTNTTKEDKTSNPQTGDQVLYFVIAGIVSLVGVLTGVITLKKRFN